MDVPQQPEPDARFAGWVRERFDPVLLPHGFLFNDVFASAAPSRATLVFALPGSEGDLAATPITRETALLYEASPGELLARRPELREWVHPDDHCADLWIRLDMDSNDVEAALGLDLIDLLAELGQDTSDLRPAPGESIEHALDRYALAARRLLTPPGRG